MDSTRGIGGLIGAIIWIMVSDVAGGIGGLAAGWMTMACVEPLIGGLAGWCVLLLSVPLGLCAGGLLGVTSLGWFAASDAFGSRSVLSNGLG